MTHHRSHRGLARGEPRRQVLPSCLFLCALGAGCAPTPTANEEATPPTAQVPSGPFVVNDPLTVRTEDLGHAFHSAEPPTGRPTAALKTEAGERWLGGAGFMARRDGPHDWFVVPLPGRMERGVASEFAVGPEGEIAVGGAGLALWSEKREELDPIAEDTIHAVAWDARGQLWAYGFGDVWRWTPDGDLLGLLSMGRPPRLVGSGGLLPDGRGSLLFATRSHGITPITPETSRLSWGATPSPTATGTFGLMVRGDRLYAYGSLPSGDARGWLDLLSGEPICTREDQPWCQDSARGQPNGPTWIIEGRRLWRWPLDQAAAIPVALPERRLLSVHPGPGGGAAVLTEGEILWIGEDGAIDDTWVIAPMQDSAILRASPQAAPPLLHGASAELDPRSGRWSFAPCDAPLLCAGGLFDQLLFSNAFLLAWPDGILLVRTGTEAWSGPLGADGVLLGRYPTSTVGNASAFLLHDDGRFWATSGTKVLAGEQRDGRLVVTGEQWLGGWRYGRDPQLEAGRLLVRVGPSDRFHSDPALAEPFEALDPTDQPPARPLSSNELAVEGGRWRPVWNGWERKDQDSDAVHRFHQQRHERGAPSFHLRAATGLPLVVNPWDARAWTGQGWVGAPDMRQGLRDAVSWPGGGWALLLEGGALLVADGEDAEPALRFPPLGDGRALATDGERLCLAGAGLACWEDGAWTQAPLTLRPEEQAIAVAVSRGGQVYAGTSLGALCDEGRCVEVSDAPITSIVTPQAGRWLALSGRDLFTGSGLDGPITRLDLPADPIALAGDGGRAWLSTADGTLYTSTTGEDWQPIPLAPDQHPTQLASLGRDRVATISGSRLLTLEIEGAAD
jgi:hypothetical protein